MNAQTFRELALKLPGVVESTHMDPPDFRADGKIFASLGVPDERWGMVKLPPKLQHDLVKRAPEVFKPCSGAWGRWGCTSVHLPSVTPAQIRPALAAAFETARSARTKRPRSSRQPGLARKAG